MPNRYLLAKRHKSATRTGGSLTLNSATWANLDTALDLTLPAIAGDIIEVGASGFFDSEAIETYMDVVSMVGGSPANHFGAGGATGRGILAWCGIISRTDSIAGGYYRTLVAGDLESGGVALRLRYRGNAAGNKTLFATADMPFHWWAKNIGPKDST